MLHYSVMLGTEGFDSTRALSQSSRGVGTCGRSMGNLNPGDIIPLEVTLTALRISPYKVGPIKGTSFPTLRVFEKHSIQESAV